MANNFFLLVLIEVWFYFSMARPWLYSFYDLGPFVEKVLAPPFEISLPADMHVYWVNAIVTNISSLPLNLLGPVVYIKMLGGSFDLVFF